MSNNFRRFCEAARSLESDLANVGSHYRLRPVRPDLSQNRPATGYETTGPSGFWVVEAVGPQGSEEQPEREIVGCVGLGRSQLQRLPVMG